MAPLGEPLHDEFGLKMMSTSPCGEVIIMVVLPWGGAEVLDREGKVGAEAVTCLCLEHCHLCYLPLPQQPSG